MHSKFLPNVLQQAFRQCSMLTRTLSGWLFSVLRLLFSILVGKLCCQQLEMVILKSPILGIDWSFLHWLNPLAGALGKATKISKSKKKIIFF